jgi:CRISPR/Cas system-associated exonuclease Cas4 (RecB family)
MGAPFNWSFSRLMTYESCPQQFKFKVIDRLPEPPKADDNPMERGNRIHRNLELFVKGEATVLTNEAKQIQAFRPALEHLRALYAAGMAVTEEDWLFDRDWDETQKRNAERPIWLWAKLDASVLDQANARAIAVDYKSGKSQYKQIEHVQQLQLYAALTALKYPYADEIHAELWYVDEGHVRPAVYTREEALRFVGRFDVRAQRLYDDKFYRPNPNVQTCKFCPYGPRNGTGVCPVGV